MQAQRVSLHCPALGLAECAPGSSPKHPPESVRNVRAKARRRQRSVPFYVEVRVEAITSRWEAIALRWETITNRILQLSFLLKPWT